VVLVSLINTSRVYCIVCLGCYSTIRYALDVRLELPNQSRSPSLNMHKHEHEHEEIYYKQPSNGQHISRTRTHHHPFFCTAGFVQLTRGPPRRSRCPRHESIQDTMSWSYLISTQSRGTATDVRRLLSCLGTTCSTGR
jgi:hypothetical protein